MTYFFLRPVQNHQIQQLRSEVALKEGSLQRKAAEAGRAETEKEAAAAEAARREAALSDAAGAAAEQRAQLAKLTENVAVAEQVRVGYFGFDECF